MVKNTTLFILSGLLSFLLFTIVLLLFFYMLFISERVETPALKKAVFVSISLDEIKTTPIKKKTIVEKKSQKKISKKTINREIKPKNIDVNNLFNNVWTKDISKKVKKVKKTDTKLIKELLSKTKKLEIKKTNTLEKKIQNIASKKLDDEIKKESTGDKVDIYNSKIHAIIQKIIDDDYNPPESSIGKIITAYISLDRFGKAIEFKIIKAYSNDEFFYKEYDRIRSIILSSIFPANPKNETWNVEVKLIIKNKE